ncbi:DUF2502 domain-containing protein [Acerihabitans arboris]|uniref:DUF2502 domain-containing protein n=1 Tax=Acerihabitans arboris TaxID=2691583 RepID=A0A845SPF7_9GAMM|nr:DUF2502 domain-containing protein [Acerihabitans arboris]NDL63065.1 DUF2502 domain-containing protein [Acerihabitans arboris]
MKQKAALLAMALLVTPSALPLGAIAGVSVNINAPGVSVRIGERNDRGYYWDGYDWRTPAWWRGHQGKHLGERNKHGEYWDGGRWSPKPPAGHGNRDKTRQQPAAHKTSSHNTGGGPNANLQQNGGNGKQGQARAGHDGKNQDNKSQDGKNQGTAGEPIKPPQQ